MRFRKTAATALSNESVPVMPNCRAASMNRSDCALSVNFGFRVAFAFGLGFGFGE